ncbi:hypothetical protein WDU94_000197, partial [Cyamophila willieti]
MTLEQTTPDIRERDSVIEPAINIINTINHPCNNGSIEDQIESKFTNNYVGHGPYTENGVTKSTVDKLNECANSSAKSFNKINNVNHSEAFKDDSVTPVHAVKESTNATGPSNHSTTHTPEDDEVYVPFEASKTATTVTKLTRATLDTAITPSGIEATRVATNGVEKTNGMIDNPKETADHNNALNVANGLAGVRFVSDVADSSNDASFVKGPISSRDINTNEASRPSNVSSAPDPNCPIDASYTINDTDEDLSVNTWQKISVLVCVFAILREFHPIESYFVKYLELLNPSFTKDVIKTSIYPVGTYSSLLLMVITFLITDYTRYKPIVVLDVLAGLLSYVLIVERPSMPIMWVQQVCIGFYHAGEVSY